VPITHSVNTYVRSTIYSLCAVYGLVFSKFDDNYVCKTVFVKRDAWDAKSDRFINRREVIRALTRSSYTGNKLHIEQHRAAWNLQRYILWLWTEPILFQ
jgi:hypothetical protein